MRGNRFRNAKKTEGGTHENDSQRGEGRFVEGKYGTSRIVEEILIHPHRKGNQERASKLAAQYSLMSARSLAVSS